MASEFLEFLTHGHLVLCLCAYSWEEHHGINSGESVTSLEVKGQKERRTQGIR